eukprot:Nitzschia sp. Nitz4//scaffold7_size249615//222711//223181//NITZ4_001211-RA/size249615-processed-gene-0.161-mRNA-1//1//CDS//3329558544//1765//frame0
MTSSSSTYSSTQNTTGSSRRPAYTNVNEEPEICFGVNEGGSSTFTHSPNSTDPKHNTNGSNKRHTKREMRGAAVGAGVVGLLVGGPVLGALAAGGAAVAVSNKGSTGEAARAGGEAVASVGDSLKRLDKKHHLAEKTRKGFHKGCNWVNKKMQPKE